MMKKILFKTNNATDDDGFWVSDEDYDIVNARNWWISKHRTTGLVNIGTYVPKAEREKFGGADQISIHRFLLGLPEGDKRVVDHIDGNRLNNIRENLRVCTQQENTRNRKLNKNSTTGYKGVCWCKQKKKYISKINLGAFNTPEEAYKAYCDAADKIFGEFSRHK